MTLTPVSVFSIFDLGPGVDVDAALFEDARQFLRNLIVFGRHEARQEFYQRDLGSEAAEDGAEFDADGARANDDERFRHLRYGEYFDVGEDAVVGLEAEDDFGVGAGGEDDVLCFDFALRALDGSQIDSVDAVLCASGESTVAGDHGDLVLLHKEAEALGVLVDDRGFALLHGVPVEGAGIDVVDAVFGRVLEVVPQFGIEEQRLGGNAAYVEASAAEDIG